MALYPPLPDLTFQCKTVTSGHEIKQMPVSESLSWIFKEERTFKISLRNSVLAKVTSIFL